MIVHTGYDTCVDTREVVLLLPAHEGAREGGAKIRSHILTCDGRKTPCVLNTTTLARRMQKAGLHDMEIHYLRNR